MCERFLRVSVGWRLAERVNERAVSHGERTRVQRIRDACEYVSVRVHFLPARAYGLGSIMRPGDVFAISEIAVYINIMETQKITVCIIITFCLYSHSSTAI